LRGESGSAGKERGGPLLWELAGRVTLAIPLRDEVLTLPALLQALECQTVKPCQIVFIDGGSRDGTVGLLRQWMVDHPGSHLIETAGAMPGEARNRGIEYASTEWVALLDAGTVPEPTWLEALIGPLLEQPVPDVVYGSYEPIIGNWFERCASLAYVPPRIYRAGGAIRAPSVASCLVRRSTWASVGGFPAGRAGEDLIFIERLTKAGARTGWAPTATVWWRLRPNLTATYQRFRLYSAHNVRAGLQRYWHYGILRQYLVYGLLLLLALLDDPRWGLGIVWLFGLRAGKRIWSRHEGGSVWWEWRWVPGVALLLLAIDIATFHGWIEAYLPARGRGTGPTCSANDRS
jgi:cellulose synthase/poly-beta-1,6-N-acetylglucosamine synthase-like glycosyltransferase